MKRIILVILILISISITFSINFGVGINIHGHIEPFVMANFEIGKVDLLAKAGFIFDNTGIAVLVPGVFISGDLNNFRPHGGFEGFWHLKENQCLFLGKIGVDYGINVKFAELYLGLDIGLPINLPGDFFVSGLNNPIPMFTAYLEF